MKNKDFETILDILEDDFGCEGVPDDAEVMVKLVLRDENGVESVLPMADKTALEMNLQVGDRIYVTPDGDIEKVQE